MSLTLVCLVPLIIALACLLVQCYFMFGAQWAVKKVHVQDAPENFPYPPISVIICARNEQANIKLFLAEILEQDYPSFEVVVVNDSSTDESEWVLREFGERYPHLKVVTLSENIKFKHGKKFALTMGIKAAQYEHLVFTDADCYPASSQWLSLMARSFGASTEILLGYSPYVRDKGLLNGYIRYEAFLTAVNYLGFALQGNPYMGVGRNMAYKKGLFFRNKGFASHMRIPSGDDDLFVNQNADSTNTAVCIHPEAFVWSVPKDSFSDYVQQKKRHFGAGKGYKMAHKQLLSLQASSGVLFYAFLVIALLVHFGNWPFVVALYMVRLIALYVAYTASAKKMAVADLLVILPVLDFLYQLGNPLIAVRAFMSKKEVQWK